MREKRAKSNHARDKFVIRAQSKIAAYDCQDNFFRCVAHAKVSVLMPKRECQWSQSGSLLTFHCTPSLRQRLDLLAAEACHDLPAVMHLDAPVAQL